MWCSVALVSESVGVFPLICLFPYLSQPQFHICCSSVFSRQSKYPSVNHWLEIEFPLPASPKPPGSFTAPLSWRGRRGLHKNTSWWEKTGRCPKEQGRPALKASSLITFTTLTSSLSLAQKVDFNIFVAISEISRVNPKKDFKIYKLTIFLFLLWSILISCPVSPTPQNQVKCWPWNWDKATLSHYFCQFQIRRQELFDLL